MNIAFFVPHNEGVESGIITGPGFTSETTLVDLFEVDASIRSFEHYHEAEEWLKGKHEEIGASAPVEKVPGGDVSHVDYDE